MAKKNIKKVKKELEEIIEAEKHKLEVERATFAGRIEEINRKVNRLPMLEKRLAEVKDELNNLVFLKKERMSDQREIYSLSREIKKLEKINLKIEKEGKTLASKVNLLIKSALNCPICERKLTNPYKAMLLGEFKKIYKEKRTLYQNNLKTAKSDKKRIKNLDDKIREKDIVLLGKEELERQKVLILNEVEESKKISSDLPKLCEKQEFLTQELSKKAFAPLTQKMLDQIEEDSQGF